MSFAAYYNENDAFAAQWLRNLIAAGHIAPGDVDERSIVDVRADDLRGYTQCHFFAGIGIWSYALRRAGWSDDRPAWTGSCPCQPFSAAGKGEEFDDARHLWPTWFRLISECRPVVAIGEQVASKDGLAWLDHVCFDLESAGYTVGTVDTCAAGYGAPHIRQRLYFVAKSGRELETRIQPVGFAECGEAPAPRIGGGFGELADAGLSERRPHVAGRNNDHRQDADAFEGASRFAQRGCAGDLADSLIDRQSPRSRDERGSQSTRKEHGHNAERRRVVGNTVEPRLERHIWHGDNGHESGRLGAFAVGSAAQASGACNGFWRDAEWIACIDGKARPVEPGTFPLAHGTAGRVGRLRAYGNAIVAEQAIEFIVACMIETAPC